MKKAKIRHLASLLCLMLLLQAVCGLTFTANAAELPSQIGITAETEDEYLCNYKEIASDKKVILYADEKRGHIALQNIASGHIWYSVPNDFLLDDKTVGEKRMNIYSDVLVGYISDEEEGETLQANITNSHSDALRDGKIESQQIENGIKFIYHFSSISAQIPVTFTVGNGYLEVSLDIENIKCAKNIKISSVNILPAFGAGNSTDNGYIFVPDGSGAVINFNNGVETAEGYSGVVYGEDLAQEVNEKKSNLQTVLMPVFGIKKGSEGLFGIVSRGDGITTIKAENGNEDMGYNIVSPQADLRAVSKITLYENDYANRTTIMRLSQTPVKLKKYTVRYNCFSGEEANYSGFAKCYREYLINEKGLKKAEDGPIFDLTLYGAADVQKTFLGIPYTYTQSLTTFSQAEEILTALKNDGIDNIRLNLVGFTNSGILNRKLPKNFKAIRKLGGNKGLKDLIAYCEKSNITLSLDVDFQRYRKSGNGYSKSSDATKTTFGEACLQNEFLSSTYSVDNSAKAVLLLKPEEMGRLSEKLLKKVPKGIDNISFSFLGKQLYSNLENNGTFRSEAQEIYINILNSYKKAGKTLSFQNACAYTFPYADTITDTPMSSSGYNLFDYDVPFYQMVLKGYVNMFSKALPYELDGKNILLKSAETGINLAYHGMYTDSAILNTTRYDKLYSTTYTLWQNDAKENYKKLLPLLSQVDGASIEQHNRLENGLVVTKYDNGVSVLVNYSDSAKTAQGITVSASDFAIVR